MVKVCSPGSLPVSSELTRYERGGILLCSLCMLGLFLSFATAGCARTRQSGIKEEAGFLQDYSRLRKGEDGEAQLIWINPDTDFSMYDKILLESVELYVHEGSDFHEIPKETQKLLTGHFYKALHTELEKDYEIVNVPGPNTMRVRFAITEAAGAKVVLNTVTTVLPQAWLVSALGGRAADKAFLVGEAGFEGEVTDAETGELLGAGVDRRVGAKTLRGAFSKWGDVLAAFDTWAKNFRNRLEKLRTRKQGTDRQDT